MLEDIIIQLEKELRLNDFELAERYGLANQSNLDELLRILRKHLSSELADLKVEQVMAKTAAQVQIQVTEYHKRMADLRRLIEDMIRSAKLRNTIKHSGPSFGM